MHFYPRSKARLDARETKIQILTFFFVSAKKIDWLASSLVGFFFFSNLFFFAFQPKRRFFFSPQLSPFLLCHHGITFCRSSPRNRREGCSHDDALVVIGVGSSSTGRRRRRRRRRFLLFLAFLLRLVLDRRRWPPRRLRGPLPGSQHRRHRHPREEREEE